MKEFFNPEPFIRRMDANNNDLELPDWIKQLEDLIEDAEAEARLQRRKS